MEATDVAADPPRRGGRRRAGVPRRRCPTRRASASSPTRPRRTPRRRRPPTATSSRATLDSLGRRRRHRHGRRARRRAAGARPQPRRRRRPRRHARKPPAAIVLLSDGKSMGGRDPTTVARAAGRLGVPIYTVALGTPDGVVDGPVRRGHPRAARSRRAAAHRARLRRAVLRRRGRRAARAPSTRRLGSQLGTRAAPSARSPRPSPGSVCCCCSPRARCPFAGGVASPRRVSARLGSIAPPTAAGGPSPDPPPAAKEERHEEDFAARFAWRALRTCGGAGPRLGRLHTDGLGGSLKPPAASPRAPTPCRHRPFQGAALRRERLPSQGDGRADRHHALPGSRRAAAHDRPEPGRLRRAGVVAGHARRHRVQGLPQRRAGRHGHEHRRQHRHRHPRLPRRVGRAGPALLAPRHCRQRPRESSPRARFPPRSRRHLAARI